MGKVFIGNFKGPKGDTGPQGKQGIQGIPGPAGPTGTVDTDTPVDFTEASALENIESGESLSAIFGKIRKIAGSLLIGAGSTLLGQNLAAARALVSDVNGKVGTSTITAAELGYLAGLTKNAQSQFNELNENISKKQDASTAITTENIGQQSVLNASIAHSVAWDDVYSKPTTGYPPSSHTHDDRYYTESEVNNLLNGKAASSHTHDDRYYTESEVNNLLNGKAASSHTHDDRYYTESEVNNLVWNEIHVKEYSADNVSVSTGTKTQEFSIALSGYWIVGLVQASIENASSGGINSSQCSIYGYGFYSQSTAYVRFRAWADAKVKVIIKVLYWKDPR